MDIYRPTGESCHLPDIFGSELYFCRLHNVPHYVVDPIIKDLLTKQIELPVSAGFVAYVRKRMMACLSLSYLDAF